MLKVNCFKNTSDNRPFLNVFYNLSKILIFPENSFLRISFVKLTPLHFFDQNSEISLKGISFLKLIPWPYCTRAFPDQVLTPPYGVQLSIYTARATDRVARWTKWPQKVIFLPNFGRLRGSFDNFEGQKCHFLHFWRHFLNSFLGSVFGFQIIFQLLY